VALQELFAVRRVPLAPGLVGIADGEALLAEMTAAWLAERPHDAAADASSSAFRPRPSIRPAKTSATEPYTESETSA
jgi:hypothetical protein